MRDAVDVGGGGAREAVAAQVVGAEGVDADEEDVTYRGPARAARRDGRAQEADQAEHQGGAPFREEKGGPVEVHRGMRREAAPPRILPSRTRTAA